MCTDTVLWDLKSQYHKRLFTGLTAGRDRHIGTDDAAVARIYAAGTCACDAV